MAKKQKFQLSIKKLKLVKKEDEDPPEDEAEFLENSFLPHLRSMLDWGENRLRWLRGRRD